MEGAATPRAQLSSITTALDDLARRVTEIAEQSTGTDLDWLANDLFEVERSLGDARRRLTRVGERLRP